MLMQYVKLSQFSNGLLADHFVPQINVLRAPAHADVPARKMPALMELRVRAERDRRVSYFPCSCCVALCCCLEKDGEAFVG